MRRIFTKIFLGSCLLFAASLLGGCADNPDDKDFYYRGWLRPRMTDDDQTYFYKGKGHSTEPEDPRLPSGQLQ